MGPLTMRLMPPSAAAGTRCIACAGDIGDRVEVGFEQFHAELGRHAVDRPGLALFFVGPDDDAVTLHAQVPALVRIANHRQFVIETRRRPRSDR